MVGLRRILSQQRGHPPAAGAVRRPRHNRDYAGRLARGGGLQCARRLHRLRRHDASCRRDQGIGGLQQRHSCREVGRRRAVHRRCGARDQPGQLAPVHPAQHGHLRPFRLERRRGGRRRGLLRLHRIRRRQHGGAGDAQPAARHADRHHRIASDLHGPLPGGFGDSDRRPALHGTGRAGSDREGGRPRGHGAERARGGPHADADQAGRDRWALLGGPGDVAGPVARLLQHVARRPAAAVHQPGASALQDAVDHLDHHRRRGGVLRRALAGARGWQPVLDRHPAGVRHRVQQRARAADPRAAPGARIQDAGGLVRGTGRGPFGTGADGRAAVADMAPPDRLVPDRHGGLLPLRAQALEAAHGLAGRGGAGAGRIPAEIGPSRGGRGSPSRAGRGNLMDAAEAAGTLTASDRARQMRETRFSDRVAAMRPIWAMAAGVLAVAAQPAGAAPGVAGDLIVFNDNGAWCWYQDERVIVDKSAGALLVASVAAGEGVDGRDRAGDVDVASYDLSTGRGSRFVLHHHLLTQDDHNTPALLVRPDGRYLAVYSRHNSEKLTYWRVSVRPHDAGDWQPERSFDWSRNLATADAADNVTYSNVFYLPAENRAYDFARAVNRDPCALVSTDQGDSWSYGGKLLTESRLGYVNGYTKYASNG